MLSVHADLPIMAGLSDNQQYAFAVTVATLAGGGVVRWYSEGWDSDKGQRFFFGTTILAAIMAAALYGLHFCLKNGIVLSDKWRERLPYTFAAVICATIFANILISARSITRRNKLGSAVTLEIDEVDLCSENRHHLITSQPGFLYYWVLKITINIIATNESVITAMGKKCSAQVFRTHQEGNKTVKNDQPPLLEFLGLEIVVGQDETPVSDLLVSRPMEIILRGGLNRNDSDLPDNAPLLVELFFREAAEVYGVTIPILLEYLTSGQRWHAFRDPTKYRLERLTP